jgi:hypothetical protein
VGGGVERWRTLDEVLRRKNVSVHIEESVL